MAGKSARRTPTMGTGTSATSSGKTPPAAPAEDARYSIRITSRLTGVELDTLRMWERRYGFPRPQRTAGGSRVYSGSDVEALKLIQRALEHGYRPGEVVGKPTSELVQLVAVTSQGSAPAAALTSAVGATGAPTLASLLATLGRDDLASLRAQLRQAAVVLGPKRFVTEIAQPISVRVGELWAEGQVEVRHEHMLTECLSSQLHLLRAAQEDRVNAPRVLLSTLPDERHGLGLEMVELYLALGRITPLHLGIDTPPEQIVKAARAHEADAVGLLVTPASDLKAVAKQIRWMLAELPRRVPIWVGGGGAPELHVRDEGVRVIATWADLDEEMATLERRI